MNGIAWMGTALAAFALAYALLGGWLSRRWGVDVSRKTPAVEREDGVRWRPTGGFALLGGHAASFAAMGVLAGASLSASLGWAGAMLWMLAGSLLVGGVSGYSALFVCVRHEGESLPALVGEHLGERSRKAFGALAALGAALTAAAFAQMAGSALSALPISCPAQTAGAAALALGAVLALLPARGERPLGLLGGALIFGVMVACAAGVWASGEPMATPAFDAPASQEGIRALALLLIPFAASGHQALSAGMAAKRLRGEGDAQKVGLGGALLAGALGVCALITAGTSGDAALARALGLPQTAVEAGLTAAFALLCLSGLVSALRVGAALVMEGAAGSGLPGKKRVLARRMPATLLGALAALAAFALGEALWMPCASAGLLVSACALLTCAAWFRQIGRGCGAQLVALALASALALAALCAGFALNVQSLLSGAASPVPAMVSCALLLLSLAAGMRVAAEGLRALWAQRT